MLENTTNISIEQLVEIVGVTTGSVIAVGKGILSFCELISSYNIEIGLMTKKEQWKFRITNLAMLTFSIWLLNVLFCFVCSDERVICVVFLCCMIIFLVWGISCLLLAVMWLLNKRKVVLINTNVEGYVRVLCFVAFLLFGITFNDCLVFYGTEKYNVWIGSFLMTVLIMEMFIWLADFSNQSGIAKICYYDLALKKNIFVFFRYDEDLFMCGNASKMNECDENYLVPYKRIQEAKLLPISRDIKQESHVNCRRVIIQTSNVDYELEKILNKVKDALKNQNITQGKIDETYIYIKPSDKKAYYVTPDEVTDSVEL